MTAFDIIAGIIRTGWQSDLLLSVILPFANDDEQGDLYA